MGNAVKLNLPPSTSDLVAQVLDDLLFKMYDPETGARYLFDDKVHTIIDALRSRKTIEISHHDRS